MAVTQQVGNLIELAHNRFTPQPATEMVVPLAEQVRRLLDALDFFGADIAERTARGPFLLWGEPPFDALDKRRAHRQGGDGSRRLPPIQHQVPPCEEADGLHGMGGYP